MRFVVRMAISAAALIGIAYLSDGALLDFAGAELSDQIVPALLTAVLLAIVNATIGKIAKFIANVLTLPVGCITLGLSSLVIGLLVNTAMFYLVEAVIDGFLLIGFWETVLAALIMAVVTAVASKITEKDD